MKDKAKKSLIQKLISEKSNSKQELISLYAQFKQEVNTNLNKMGSYPIAYLYLKKLEFDFIECQNSCYKYKNAPIQLELFSIEENKIKKKK